MIHWGLAVPAMASIVSKRVPYSFQAATKELSDSNQTVCVAQRGQSEHLVSATLEVWLKSEPGCGDPHMALVYYIARSVLYL